MRRHLRSFVSRTELDHATEQATASTRNYREARGQEGWLAPAVFLGQLIGRGQATLLTPSTRAAQVPTVGAKAHRSFCLINALKLHQPVY